MGTGCSQFCFRELSMLLLCSRLRAISSFVISLCQERHSVQHRDVVWAGTAASAAGAGQAVSVAPLGLLMEL